MEDLIGKERDRELTHRAEHRGRGIHHVGNGGSGGGGGGGGSWGGGGGGGEGGSGGGAGDGGGRRGAGYSDLEFTAQ
jgi:hypothetical protein